MDYKLIDNSVREIWSNATQIFMKMLTIYLPYLCMR